MNKLVSKNPVLRFKEGKKIIKALSGVPMFYGIAPLKNWKGIVGQLNLTDEEKRILDLEEIDYGTAKDLLLWINRYINGLKFYGIGNSDLNFLNDYIAEDNKWGAQSLAGLDWLIDKLKRVHKPLKDVNGNNIDDYNFDTNNGGILREKDGFIKKPGLIYIEHLSPNPQLWVKGEGEYVNTLPYQSLLPELKGEIPGLKIKPTRTNNYSRKDIRNLIKSENFNAYNYTGALRKALRKYLNGESDDTSLLDGTDLARFTLPYRKQGGQLVSKNPILRFKSNFRKVAQ